MSFNIRVDDKAVLEAIDGLDRKMAKSKVQKALSAGAKFLKPKVKAATPTGPGHFGYHLKNRVSAGAAKRNKPAAIVKYRSAREHFTLLGTRAHSTVRVRSNKSPIQKMPDGGYSSGHQVSGARANPVISRVADQYQDEALAVVERELARLLDLD